jgi:hypothetical protein
VSAITASEGQGSISEVSQGSNRTAFDRYDLGPPGDIGVAHGDRPAAMIAPDVGLEKGKIGVPGDVDAWRRVTRRGQQRNYLCLITLEQYDFDRKDRLLMEVAAHTLPDRNYLGIVCHCTYPDCSAHLLFLAGIR